MKGARLTRVHVLRAVMVAGGLLIGLLAGGAALLARRIIHSRSILDQRTYDYAMWALGPCYRVDGDRLRRVVPPGRASELNLDFPRRKAPGTRRIAVVGESTGEMLEQEMAAEVAGSGCAGRIEVLECSTFGAHPDLAVRRAEEVMAYAPDVLVVAIGHNYRNPRMASTPGAAPPPPEDMNGAAPDAADVPRMARASYARILAVAAPHGVKVMALQLASNLLFSPRTDPSYVFSPERAAAWMQWAHGDVPAAIRTLESPPERDGALRAFERATFRAQQGDWATARAEYVLARDLDLCFPSDLEGGCAHRASTRTNAVIAEITHAAGGETVDVDALFSRDTPHGIVGWETLWDYCHPNREPLGRLARAVLGVAAPDSAACLSMPVRVAPASGPRYPEVGRVEAAYQSLVGPPQGAADVAHAENIGWNAFPDNSGWRRHLDGPTAFVLRTAPDEAAAILERYDREKLSARTPDVHAAILAAIGAAARDQGRIDLARWALERSRAVAPTAPALAQLALVRIRQGDEAGGRAVLAEASALDPADLQVRNLVARLP